ncbi:Bacterial type II secretion system protein F domain protein [compost metagenome]
MFQYISSVVMAAAAIVLVALIFYKSWIFALVLSPLSLLYPKIRLRGLRAKRKQELTLQFRQALYSLASSLAAGRSVSNSFAEIVKDLELLYPDPDTYIIKELNLINQRVDNGESIEMPLMDFSIRAGIEDVTNFINVFMICRTQGGDLVEVIRRTSNMIGEKIEVKLEIEVLIAGKKFESTAMMFAPLLLIAGLTMFSGDYMAPLYDGLQGRLVMTASLLVLGGCFYVSKRIMDIKV